MSKKKKKARKQKMLANLLAPPKIARLSELWTLDPTEDRLTIGPEALHQLAAHFLAHNGEVGGLFLVKDGAAVWFGLGPFGSTARVTGNIEYTKLVMECYEATGESPNGQWHTHPGMRCFWSGTDENDQVQTINSLRKNGRSGVAYFLVVDGLEMKLRTVRYGPTGVTYQDGCLMINNQPTFDTVWERQVRNKPYWAKGDKVTFKFQEKELLGVIHRVIPMDDPDTKHRDWLYVEVKEGELKGWYNVPKAQATKKTKVLAAYKGYSNMYLNTWDFQDDLDDYYNQRTLSNPTKPVPKVGDKVKGRWYAHEVIGEVNDIVIYPDSQGGGYEVTLVTEDNTMLILFDNEIDEIMEVG